MNGYDCDTVRELIPAYVRNELLAAEAASAASHVADCASCAEETRVVRLVHGAQPALPPGLEARVLLAVRRPQVRWSWQPRRIAVAATVAGALVGGSLLVQRLGLLEPRPDAASALVSLDAGEASVLTWAAAEDPLLHGTSALQQLSVEELELLLAELES